jgi:hypothetical protein
VPGELERSPKFDLANLTRPFASTSACGDIFNSDWQSPKNYTASKGIRHDLLSLRVFVRKKTLDIMAYPEARKLDVTHPDQTRTLPRAFGRDEQCDGARSISPDS